MKLIISLFLLFAMLPFTAVSAKDKDPYKYELVGTGLTPQSPGYIIVKVWNYGKKEVATSDLCLQSAIEALLFKGYSGVGNDRGKEPLIPDGRSVNPDYFDSFFSSGAYKQFVSFSNNGNVEPEDIIKLSSKQYKFKIGMVVMVDYDGLQKRLEKDGLLRSARSIADKMF